MICQIQNPYQKSAQLCSKGDPQHFLLNDLAEGRSWVWPGAFLLDNFFELIPSGLELFQAATRYGSFELRVLEIFYAI